MAATQSDKTPKPKLPLILILVGSIIQILTSLLFISAGILNFIKSLDIAGGILGILLFVFSIVCIIGAVKAYSTDKKTIKNWSIACLILAIISLIISSSLSWLGSLPIAIGAIIGLVYASKK